MNVEILIVSCAKHFDWLEYCLRSIARFAHDFSGVTVVVPEPDLHIAVQRWPEMELGDQPVKWPECGDEWKDKGMLWHFAQILNADRLCPDADFILHTDSDCMFSEPVTPDDYFVDGKPVLMHASFEWLVRCQQANLSMWKEAAEKALGWSVDQETMRRHPAVHGRLTYEWTRNSITRHHGRNWDEYILSCSNDFPQTFAEFPTLGAVAWHLLHDHYHWINQETEPFPHSKIVQFWSHSPPGIPQRPIYNGQPFECTPDYFLK